MPVQTLGELLRHRTWVALTGAGISTDSGIPDYRGPNASKVAPVQHADFVRFPRARQRYWARSLLGWRSFGQARPNAGHVALAALAGHGLVGVITQNVDGLHQAAGSPVVLDLHGRIGRVVCLACGRHSGRARLQERLDAANPGVAGTVLPGQAEMDAGEGAVRLRPDGDAVVEDWEDFVVVDCEDCGGILKPDVVFFGESVPSERVEQAYAMVESADVLVVVGSSLTVMSGLRFARHQVRRGLPLAIVNQGATRADDLATLRIDAGCSPTLATLRAALQAESRHPSVVRPVLAGVPSPNHAVTG